MSDLISRQEVLGLKTIAPVMNGEAVHYEEVVFIRDLEKLPSVESERKTGKWIRDKFWSVGIGMGEQYGYFYKCSECGKEVKGGYTECTDRFCKSCGAKMEVD